MKKTWGIVAIAAVLVALTGCSSEGADGVPEPAAASAEETVAPTPEAAPITMEPTEEASPVDPSQDFGDYTPDEFFVLSLTSAWRGEVPSDDALIGAAKLACEARAAGTAESDVVAVEGEGEDAAWNNARLTQYAIQVYCPEFTS